MGIHVIKMPDLGEGIAEVEVVAWRVAPGDTVTEDQVLADVMTDKATVEIPSPVHGTVLALGGAVGESLAVGAELIRLEVEGAGNARPGSAAPASAPAAGQAAAHTPAQGGAATADYEPADIPHGPIEAPRHVAVAGGGAARPAPAPAPAAPAPTPAAKRPDAPPPARPYVQAGRPGHAGTAHAGTAPAPRLPARAQGEKPLAAPAVRKRAWDLGIELQYVAGSGPAGHVTHADLDAYLSGAVRGQGGHGAGADGRYAELQGEQNVPLIGLRRKIAEKMQLAKRQIPHFTYVEEVDVTELEALRTQLNARYGDERPRLTLLPLLMRALVLAVRKFPEVNARYDDQANVVTRYNPVHIGIATQTDAGLMVPVVRNAEARDPWASAQEIVRLAEAARTGKAVRDELSGSTITITSLGPLGGIVTTPVINHPEVAIVGVNRILERPVVRNGGLVPRKLMNLSSSFDHRVIDGMVAAEFIQAIRGYLEAPALLFVE